MTMEWVERRGIGNAGLALRLCISKALLRQSTIIS